MEEHILDLTKRTWSTTRFGVTAIGTWVKIDNRWRPCMALIRENAKPCVIPLEDAWRWDDRSRELEFLSARFCLQLGVHPTMDNRHKLISLVHSRLVDLITMPPRPPDAEEHVEPVAEVTLNNDLTGNSEVEL